jgi:hypothetical protein
VVAYNPVKQHISSEKLFDEDNMKRFLEEVEKRKVRTFLKEEDL